MRNFYVFFIILLVYSLYSQQIDEITRFTYNHLAVDFDDYTGSIIGHEDRLFVTSYGRLQEIQVSPNGELTQLSSFENGYFHLQEPIIDVENEMLYCSYYTNLEDDAILYLMKFDISTTPMTHIATLPVMSGLFYGPLLLWDDYLLFLTDDADFSLIVLRLNVQTFIFEPPIVILSDIYYWVNCYYNKGNLLFLQMHPYMGNSEIFIYDLNTNQPITSSMAQINFYHTVLDMHIVDDLLYLSCHDNIFVYHIADIDNITLFTSVGTVVNNFIYIDAILYSELYLIALYQTPSGYSPRNGIHIYDISEPEQPFLVYNCRFDYSSTGKPLYISNDKLYVCERVCIGIYDLPNNYQKTTYGRYRFDFKIKDDTLIEDVKDSNEYKVYYLLNETPYVYTIDKDSLEPDVYKIADFQVSGNRLYALSYEINEHESDNYCLDVYEINSGNAQLLEIHPLEPNVRPSQMKITGEYVVLSNRFEGSRVYQYTDGVLLFVTTLVGSLEYPCGYSSQQYILNYLSNGQIEFRDINNPLIVLNTATVPHSQFSDTLRFINENTISLYSANNNYFYHFDDQYIFTHTYTYSSDRYRYVYNGIVSYKNPTDDFTVYLATMVDGHPRAIAQENFGFIDPLIYIFPESHKMILQSLSGVHVYDIEYTVPVKDIVEKQLRPFLHSNYPNPFNPATTISFEMAREGAVSLVVYNSKGQRVCVLVDGVRGTGEHKVVWDGVSDDGRSVGSGVYFYRMVSDDFVGVKKMVMVK